MRECGCDEILVACNEEPSLREVKDESCVYQSSVASKSSCQVLEEGCPDVAFVVLGCVRNGQSGACRVSEGKDVGVY